MVEPEKITDMSFCIIVFDSCRYDTMLAAEAPFIKSQGTPLKAYSPATYTLPAHISFFAGILPQVIQDLPYYNRYNKQLFSLNKQGELIEGQLGFDNSPNIICGFKTLGYQTIGTGAANWFSSPILQMGFDKFLYEPYRYMTPPFFAAAQTDFILSNAPKRTGEKYFAFINYCETHTPFMGQYEINARTHMAWPPDPVSQRAVNDGIGQSNPAFRAQINAIDFLDRHVQRLYDKLPGPAMFILTADHGECFGEDGFWGHGINHPKVFEVPMLIFLKDKK